MPRARALSGRGLAAGPRVVLLTVLGATVAVAATLLVPVQEPYREPGTGQAVVAAASVLCLVAWRRLPLVVLGLAGAAVVVTSASGHDVWVVQWPAWLAFFACFTTCRAPGRSAATAVAFAGLAGYAVTEVAPVTGTDLTTVAVCFGIAGAAGDAVRTRRAAAEAATARGVAQARERAAATERLVLEQRQELARELHDSLGHTVTVLVLQAGIGRRVGDRDPQYARDCLARIETMGRDALEELDRMLRLLPAPADPGRPGPRTGHDWTEPALEDVEGLAAGVRAAGRSVRLDLDLGTVRVEPRTARTMYRIVQEALTNAVRHGRGGEIRVRIARDGGSLVAEIGNDGQGLCVASTGRGLLTMAERARLEGGTFECGPVEGGFRVRATLPAPGPVPGPAGAP